MTRQTPRRSVALLGWLAAALLGLLLVVAACLKALDPEAFASEIARQGASFGLPPYAAALAALALEAGLGAALILDLRRRGVLVAAAGLVAYFLFLTGRTAWRAAHGLADAGDSCGCFGNLVERTPTEAFVQDLLMMVPPAALAWLGRPGARRGVRARVAAATALALGVAAFASQAPALPLDDWATRLRPGVEISDLCAGAGAARVCLPTAAPALAQGNRLVVIADTSTDEFVAQAMQLNDYVRGGGALGVVVLADLTPEDRMALFWQVAPAFDLQATPTALLRPLHRRLPRSFEVREGRVVATWSGLPPQLQGAGEAGARTIRSEKQ